MFKRFLPETIDFFKFFDEHCALIVEAASELMALSSPGCVLSEGVEKIHKLEHKADQLTHGCMTALQKTFITPFDRSQIHNLIKQLDDVMDGIDDAAARITLYDIVEVRSEFSELASIIHRAVATLVVAVRELRDLKYAREIKDAVKTVHQLENDGDKVLHTGIQRLFRENTHPYQVIQWKEIFEILELVTDRCEDVADTIEGVIIEAS